MTRPREALLVSAAAALVVVAIFLEYIPPFQRVHLWSDIVGYTYPLTSYAFSSLRAGRIPLWDRNAAAPFGIDGGGSIEATGWTPERREFRAISPHPSRLILVEQFHPGWHAAIGARSVPIERWGGAFQRIDVPAGESRVVFEFRPVSWKLGAVVSLMSLALMFRAVIPYGRRSTTATPTRTGRSGGAAATTC